MPIDNRRIQGPDVSTPYSLFISDLPTIQSTNQDKKNTYCKLIFKLKNNYYLYLECLSYTWCRWRGGMCGRWV